METKQEEQMARISTVLIGALCLLSGMAGSAAAGTHADCIKNCIDIRTAAGADCKKTLDADIRKCDAEEVKCIASAKDDAAKRGCRSANLDCKADAKEAYSVCIKSADSALKKCKDDCPPDKKPNIPTGTVPGQMSTGQPAADKTLDAAPGQPGKTGEPAGRKVKTGNIHLVCPKGTEKYCDGNNCSCWTIKD